MNFQPSARFPWATSLLISACAASLLTACGGSGGGADFAAATTTLSGTVTDASTKAGIDGVTVSMPTSSGVVSTTTKSGGSFSLQAETNNLTTSGASFIVTYSAPGRQTCQDSYTLTTGANDLHPVNCATLSPTAVGQYFPSSGAPMTHLGNGVASGRANEDVLKIDLYGPSKEVVLVANPSLVNPVAPSATPDVTAYAGGTFTVYVTFQGLEASLCPLDTVTVSQGSFFKVFSYPNGNLSDSPADGRLLDANGKVIEQGFPIPVSSLTASSDAIKVVVAAGSNCSFGTTDLVDDFAFGSVRGVFTKP